MHEVISALKEGGPQHGPDSFYDGQVYESPGEQSQGDYIHHPPEHHGMPIESAAGGGGGGATFIFRVSNLRCASHAFLITHVINR